jgi:hypothetical protein
MSTKHVDTAADLVRFGCSLKIMCAHCGAARTMRGVEVVSRCGAGDLAAIRARLRCTKCCRKAARIAVLSP